MLASCCSMNLLQQNHASDVRQLPAQEAMYLQGSDELHLPQLTIELVGLFLPLPVDRQKHAADARHSDATWCQTVAVTVAVPCLACKHPLLLQETAVWKLCIPCC
jgi:hypothetical protein